jgi:2-keto-4-pentenoate hydratase/2-oxohepta-3-ene-1,7-dioic acid hydratase in catechol pathway
VVVAHAHERGVGVYDAEEVRQCAPVSEPQKIICVGLNYAEHIDEGGQEAPDEPLLFSKFATSLIGPGDDIVWNSAYTEKVDYEVELAAVVGEHARRVPADEALGHLAGFTIANDVSARDLQFADDQWTRGKSLDTFCPLGPEIVTLDEFENPHDLALWTEVNGERVQESRTINLIFDVPELVSFCSEAFTLLPGDLLLTGTPPGVGVFSDPQIFLDQGDEVTVAIEGIGELTNGCQHR